MSKIIDLELDSDGVYKATKIRPEPKQAKQTTPQPTTQEHAVGSALNGIMTGLKVLKTIQKLVR